jgi:anti-anti-sigma factor
MNIRRDQAMRIEEHANDAAVVWALYGRLTGEASRLLERAVGRAAHHGLSRIVVDLGGVSMIDAGGLGALVTVYRASAKNVIALSLARVPARVRQLLTTTHLTKFLPIFDSVEEARSYCPFETVGLMATTGPGQRRSGSAAWSL